jgi:hypothetical protein
VLPPMAAKGAALKGAAPGGGCAVDPRTRLVRAGSDLGLCRV